MLKETRRPAGMRSVPDGFQDRVSAPVCPVVGEMERLCGWIGGEIQVLQNDGLRLAQVDAPDSGVMRSPSSEVGADRCGPQCS